MRRTWEEELYGDVSAELHLGDEETVRTKHAPVGEEIEHAFEFTAERGGFLELDESTVATDNLVRWKDEEG
jgi:hypothetical protein